MKSIQAYFDLNRETFSFSKARSIVKAFADKYSLKSLDVEKEANKLYGEGHGGGISLTVQYNQVIIEAQSSDRYERIPKDKLYVYISTDINNIEKMRQMLQYVDDIVRLYYLLKPNFGECGLEDLFAFDGTHFLKGLQVRSMMLLGPETVNSIGSKKISALKRQIYEVRWLKDGGVLLRLVEGSPVAGVTIDLEDKVANQLRLNEQR